MKRTDIFHLGNGYYVNVNYDIASDCWEFGAGGAVKRTITYISWVGEYFDTTFIAEQRVTYIDKRPTSEDHNRWFQLVKRWLGEKLLNKKQELIEIIISEQQ